MPIFFVLSGFLLFRPWVTRRRQQRGAAVMSRYARHRVRRVMPGLPGDGARRLRRVHVPHAGPEPRADLAGPASAPDLTQIYTDTYMFDYCIRACTQMWSLAVEVAFYAALPLLAYVLLTVLCRGRWRAGVLLAGLAAWPRSARCGCIVVQHHRRGCPAPPACGCPPTCPVVRRRHGAGGAARARGAVPRGRGRSVGAVAALRVHASTGTRVISPARAWWQPLAKSALYAPSRRSRWRRWSSAVGPVHRDCSAADRWCGSGEISYEIFLLHVVVMAMVMGVGVALAVVHRLDGGALRGDAGDHGPAGQGAASLDPPP